MDPFVFSAEVLIADQPAGYVPLYVQPTNLAAGINRTGVVGAAQMAKVGGSDVSFFVLRQNPFSLVTDVDVQVHAKGHWSQGTYLPGVTEYAISLADYERFFAGLESAKLLSCTGNDSLLGLIVDAISLDEFNWVVAISRDLTQGASLDLSIQFIQQFYAETRKEGAI